MTLPGGPADKAGNRYERRWAILAMLDVLAGEAEFVRIEEPGPAGMGFEFWVLRGGERSWHQCKRSASPWTIHTLCSEGVIQPFCDKLIGGDRCVFITSNGAPQFAQLVEHAAQSATWDEFNTIFLDKAGRLRFEKIVSAWSNIRREHAWACLKRIQVRTIDEKTIEDHVRQRIESLVEGEPSAIAAVLGQFADESIHVQLGAASIWKRLRSSGFRPRPWGNDQGIIERVRNEAVRFIQRATRLRIDGVEIPRAETNAAIEALQQGRVTVLTGGPGFGKSEVAAQVIAATLERGWAVLPISADATLGDSTAEVGTRLGLPASPVSVLPALTTKAPALLVLDQVDAVSLLSGRHSERFGVVADLVSEASWNAEIRLLIVCRQFDLENDHRLRGLVTRLDPVTVNIDALDDRTVDEVLTRAGATAHSSAVGRLLRVPLHLAMYVELIRSGSLGLDGVTSTRHIFDRYWDRKRQECVERMSGKDQWVEVIDLLCKRMSERQELEVAASAVDEFMGQVGAMRSAGVLISDKQRLSFFHEQFFDYCYARRFVGSGRTIQSLLVGDEQDLFRRSQVRQVLLHERNSDPAQYRSDLGWLVTSATVRPHIATAVAALTGALVDAREDDWLPWRDVIVNDPHDWRCERFFSAIEGNRAWFLVIESAGDWDGLLDDDRIADFAVRALTGMSSSYPKQVAELLARRVGRGTEWLRRASYLVRLGNVAAGPMVELLIALIDSPAGVDALGDVWVTVYGAATRSPDQACKVIERLLTRCVQRPCTGARDPIADDPILRDRGLASRALRAAALGAPAEFVVQLLPLLLGLMELTAGSPSEGRLIRDHIWCPRVFGREISFSDHLYAAMDQALRMLVASGPNDAEAWSLAELRSSPWESAHFLAARAVLGDPVRLADDAVAWLCESTDRLSLGYHGSPHWASRELIAAVTPHCSKRLLDELVEVLLAFTPEREKTVSGRRNWGRAQFTLLTAIDHRRWSHEVERRVGELSRKFGIRDVEAPRKVVAQMVGSPIPAERATHMSDDHWLAAMRKYAEGSESWRADGSPVGGAYELSQVLEAETRGDPARFAKLSLRIEKDVSEYYISAILRGLTGADLGPATVAETAAHASAVGGSEVTRWLVHFVESYARLALDESTLKIVMGIATGAPDPREDVWRISPTNPVEFYGGSIDAAGMNSARGAAALALRSLVASAPERLQAIKASLSELAADPVLAVRACGVSALRAAFDSDPDFAIATFVTAVDTEDAIFRSGEVLQFLYVASEQHYGAIEGVLARMLESRDAEVVRRGAAVMTAASYTHSELDSEVDACLAGPPCQRLGVVTVYAGSILLNARRGRCLTVLVKALDDEEPDVRKEAGNAFWQLIGTALDPYWVLFASLSGSRWFSEFAGLAIQAIERCPGRLPEGSLAVCERLAVAPAVGGDASETVGDRRGLAQIVLRLRAQASSEGQRRACLNVIDRLASIGAFGVESVLKEFER